MNKLSLKAIQLISRIFLKFGARKIFQKIGIDETKVADYLVKKTLGDDTIYEVHGFKLKKGRTTRLPILTGMIEPSQTALMKKEINPGMHVLDLGANFGWFTLVLSKLVGKKGHVYSFEPDPVLVDVIKENVRLNNLENVSVIHAAISDRTGKAALTLNDSYDTRNQVNSLAKSNNSILVDTITLDDFFKGENHRLDFIKMDIEGSEARAIEGMKECIARNPTLKIITEFNQKALKDVGSKPTNFLELLEKNGFTIKQIDENNYGVIKPINKNELLKLQVCNLFCFKV